MPNLLGLIAMAVFSTAVLTSPLWAEDRAASAGALHVREAMLRATPPNAPVAAGFLTIENRGATDDRLVSAAIDLDTVGAVELHGMTMTEGVMAMFELTDGIPVPAGETVALAPGGLHLMLVDLSGPLEAGDTHVVTLAFEAAGPVSLEAPVLTLGEIRALTDAEGGS